MTNLQICDVKFCKVIMKKTSAVHPKVTESGASLYDRWYYCELFYLFNTMNPKVLNGIGSQPQRAGS